MREVIDRDECLGFNISSTELFLEKEKEYEKLVEETFDVHFDSGLYTLKFYLLDHLMEDIEKLGSLEMLDRSP